MTEENLRAVRKVREEAVRLNLACVEATATSALLHIAFDRGVERRLPTDQARMLGQLRTMQ